MAETGSYVEKMLKTKNTERIIMPIISTVAFMAMTVC